MSVVLDTSMALSWFFEDERSDQGRNVLDLVMKSGACVPSIWRLEIANALQTSLRRKRILPAFRDEALQRLGSLSITIDPETDTYAWRETLRLSDRFALTAYDAAYLELAQRLVLPLATLDKALGAAATASNLRVMGQA